MTVLGRHPGRSWRVLDPWGVGSLAAFTLTTTLLSAYGFAAG